MIENERRKDLFVSLVIIPIIFIIVSVLANKYRMDIITHLDYGFISMIIYVLIGIISILIIPIPAITFVPIGVVIWGSFTTVLLSIFSWTVGAVITFLIAQKYYGNLFLKRIYPFRKLEEYEKRYGEKTFFTIVLVLRMFIPVGILSYALGTFSNMRLKLYITATAVGMLPASIVVSYVPEIITQLHVVVIDFLISIY
ncbi:MAG: TVP38/TMEM64 family protein [Candidatus Nomurabacteria bacterium]|nr:MAG: TVP38/TMEM64 family protein [Candidatus Nomurabacteria bacterium]